MQHHATTAEDGFISDFHVTLWLNHSNFGDTIMFHLVLSTGETFNLSNNVVGYYVSECTTVKLFSSATAVLS